MNFTGKITLALLLSLLTSSCELDHSLDIELPAGEQILMVEAYLTEGKPLQILAFNSTTLQEPVRINLLWNASVYVINGNDSVRLKNIIKFDRNSGYLYNYLNDTLVTGNVPEYKLYIEIEGRTPVRAVGSPVGDVGIEAVYYDGAMVEVKSNNLDDPSVNYYKLRISRFSGGTLQEVNQFVADMHNMPEGEITISSPLAEQVYDSLRVDLYRMDSTAFDYHRSISNALGANSDPFTPPGPFRGNIENAWGIFTCVSRDSFTIYP